MKPKLFAWMIALTAAAGGIAHAQVDEEGGQQKYGVIHNIAEDRKVERVGGIYEPEGIDKYMKRRFDSLEQRLTAIEGKIDAVGSQVAALAKMVEENEKKRKEEGALVSESKSIEKKRPA